MKTSHNQQNTGVLYIRYDKNSLCGQIIEMRKKKSGATLNKWVLKLLFLSEIIEPLNLPNFDYELLNDAYLESLKLFAVKYEQANYKISTFTAHMVRLKNRKLISPLTGDLKPIKDLTFLPSHELVGQELNRAFAIDNKKTIQNSSDATYQLE